MQRGTFRRVTLPLRLSDEDPIIPFYIYINDSFEGDEPLHISVRGSGKRRQALSLGVDEGVVPTFMEEEAPWFRAAADPIELFPGGMRRQPVSAWEIRFWHALIAVFVFLTLQSCTRSNAAGQMDCPNASLLSPNVILSSTVDTPSGLNRFYGVKALPPNALPELAILKSMRAQPLAIFDDLVSATNTTRSILKTLLEPLRLASSRSSFVDLIDFFKPIADSVSTLELLTSQLALIIAEPYYLGDPERRSTQDILGPVKVITDIDLTNLISRFLEKWFRLNVLLEALFASGQSSSLAELTLHLAEETSAPQALAHLDSFFETGTSSPSDLELFFIHLDWWLGSLAQDAEQIHETLSSLNEQAQRLLALSNKISDFAHIPNVQVSLAKMKRKRNELFLHVRKSNLTSHLDDIRRLNDRLGNAQINAQDSSAKLSRLGQTVRALRPYRNDIGVMEDGQEGCGSRHCLPPLRDVFELVDEGKKRLEDCKIRFKWNWTQQRDRIVNKYGKTCL